MPTLQTLPISISALGSHIVITGNSGTPTIQVVGIYFQCAVGTTIIVKSGTTALTGSMSFTSGGGFNLPNSGVGNVYYECDSGNDFILDLTGLTGQVGGSLMFYQF